MKKIIITIIALSTIIIVFFIFYIPRQIDRNMILYRSLTTYDDIVYKNIDDNDLTLDICMPTKNVYELVPMIFYVHGGSFTSGDKTEMTLDIGEDVAIRMLEEGYAIISVNYRLLDEDTHMPANIVDIKDAIRYINSIAGDYGLDPDNIGIWGTSTGAYLALTVAYSPSGLFLGAYNLRNYPAEVNYVIDFYGPTEISESLELEAMSVDELEETQIWIDALYGPGMDLYNLTADDYEIMSDYDPVSFISSDTVPTIIVHGWDDDVVDLHQSELLEARLLTYSIDYQFYKILAGTHGLVGISDSEVTNICNHVIDFLDSVYVNNV